MNTQVRLEFSYFELRAALLGGFFFLLGAFFVGLMLGHLLGLAHVKFEGSPADAIPFAVILGLVFMSAGVWALSKSFDRRPVVVVDSEGLFYRSYGESLIPWRDICAVEWETANDRIVLTRHSASRVD